MEPSIRSHNVFRRCRIRFQRRIELTDPAFITTISNVWRQAYGNGFYNMFQTISVRPFRQHGQSASRIQLRRVSATALHLAADRDDRIKCWTPETANCSAISRPMPELANNPYTFGILEL
jgi:hypothetical protein